MDCQQAAGKREVGGGLVQPPLYHAGEKEEKTLGQFLDELCAYYMAIGMPRETFMFGERDEFDDYELAYEYKRIHENTMLHLQGFYDYMAVSCALSSAFAQKGKKGTPYPQYPVPITETERKAEKERNIMHTLNVVRNRKRGRGDG